MIILNTFIFSSILLSIIRITLSDVDVYNESNKLIKSFDDQGARFGPSFPSEGLKGYITITNPQTACQKISPPPAIPTGRYQWIALIPRTQGSDSCEFAVKVQNAQNANFSAVIIYNFDDQLISMGSSAKDVRIPATLIRHTDGLTLISHYLYNKTAVNSTPIYHVQIVPEAPFKIGYYLIPVVIIASLTLFLVIGFILVRCHLQRRRTRRHRLPRSALKQLKIKKFVKTDPWEVCVICLDDFEVGAKLRILPCNHAYHMKCIDPWLLNNRRQCPVCKRYVFPNLDNSDDDGSRDHQQPRAPTEQTPLVHSNNNNLTTEISRNQPILPSRFLNPLNSGVPNISYASNESSDSSEDLSSSLTPRTTTTTEVVFNQSSLNSGRYGSLHRPFMIPSAANLLVGTTSDTNVLARSIVEDLSDIETIDDDDDDDEQMHSVIRVSEENPAYVPEEESTDTIRTHL